MRRHITRESERCNWTEQFYIILCVDGLANKTSSSALPRRKIDSICADRDRVFQLHVKVLFMCRRFTRRNFFHCFHETT